MKKYVSILYILAILGVFLFVAIFIKIIISDDSNLTFYEQKTRETRLKMSELMKSDKESENMKVEKPFAAFSGATGWTCCTTERKWVGMKNAISGFDNLDSLRFGYRYFDNVKYLYFNKLNSYLRISKNSKKGEFVKSKSPFNIIYVIDYDEYVDQVEQLTDNDNIIVLNVIEFCTSTTNLSIENIYMKNKVPIESNKKLIIKFRIDMMQNIAYFLSYSSDGSKVNCKESFLASESPSPTSSGWMEGVLDPISGISSLQDIIQSDALYENFYYEAPADKFLEFIQAPLVQYEKEAKKK